jgi:hypothetical protein
MVGRALVLDLDRGGWVPADPSPGGGGPSPLDRRFQPAGGGRASDLRTLLEALRAGGVVPHRDGPEADADWALRVWAEGEEEGSGRASFAANPQAKDASAPGTVFGMGESAVEADWRIGCANGFFPAPGHPDYVDEAAVSGSLTDMVGDLRDAGVGAVRRAYHCDLWWASLFPTEDAALGEQVPAPLDIVANLHRDDFAAFTRVTKLVLTALVHGLEVSLTLFNMGGGDPLNQEGESTDKDDPNGPTLPGSGVLWAAISAAMPDRFRRTLAPSGHGWADWYHDPVAMGLTATDEERLFQKYAIAMPSDQDGVYERACAYRKQIGLAAFSSAVARYLAAVDRVLRKAVGLGIEAVVPRLELFNEVDQYYWVKDLGEESERFALSVMEYATVAATLAAPIAALLPALRFRLGELTSWVEAEVIDGESEVPPAPYEWLGQVVATGLPAVLAEWKRLQVGDQFETLGIPRAPDAGYENQRRACAEAGFWWPPFAETTRELLDLSPTNLAHEVGFHWFHASDVPAEKERLRVYRGSEWMQRNLATLQTETIEAALKVNHPLAITLSAIGFPAEQPSPDAAGDVPYYGDANPLLQAGMLVRTLLVPLALGVESVSWFTFQARIAGPARWGSVFATMGLHEDFAEDPDAFVQADSFRRSSWYSLRRLVWLRRRFGTLSVPVNETEAAGGLTLVRCETARPVRASFGGPSYRTLYLAWVDQEADAGDRRFTLDDPDGDGAEPVSMVPLLRVPAVPRVFQRGYPVEDAVEWTWSWGDATWDGAGTIDRQRDGRLRVTVRRTVPLSTPAPFCFLSNAEFVEGSVR